MRNRKKTLFIALSLLFVQSLFSQKLDWINTIGGNGIGSDWDYGEKVAHDPSGNVILATLISDSATINQNQSTLSSFSGVRDIHLSKYSPNGSLIWSFVLGGSSSDVVRGLKVDINGIIYIAIGFSGTIDIDPSSYVDLRHSINGRCIIAKFSPGGSLISANQIDAFIFNIQIDDLSNIYATGLFRGACNFSTDILNPFILNSKGLSDAFICKYDLHMNLIWAKQLGGRDNENGYSIAIDDNYNVYTAGLFQGLIDINPGPGIGYLYSVGTNEIFISKLNVNGDYVWGRKITSTGRDAVFELKWNDSALYMSGYYNGTITLGVLGFTKISSGGLGECFLIKMKYTGVPEWIKTYNNTGYSRNWALTLLPNGDVVTGGHFIDSLKFDGLNSPFTLISTIDNSFLVIRDSQGNLKQTIQFGDTSFMGINHISSNNTNSIVCTGYFEGAFNYNLGGSTQSVSALGRGDGFIFQFKPSFVTSNSNKNIDSKQSHNSIYPNPFNESFVLKTNAPFEGDITLFDGIGQKVIEYKNIRFETEKELSPLLQRGTYYMHLIDYNKKTKSVLKLIKD